jgi:hypothetical protein
MAGSATGLLLISASNASNVLKCSEAMIIVIPLKYRSPLRYSRTLRAFIPAPNGPGDRAFDSERLALVVAVLLRPTGSATEAGDCFIVGLRPLVESTDV